MKQMTTLAAAMLLALGLSAAPVFAGHHENPCNPCSMQKSVNPCNPCSMKKHANPCSMNPCSMKRQANPCNPCSMKKQANPCNPCSMKQGKHEGWGTPGNTAIREHAFDNFRQAADAGRKLWNDEKLGTSGLSCASCHSGYENLNLDKNRNYPHFVKMVGDVVTLDQMINYCMLNPMKGEQFEQNAKELTALAAYFRAYRMQYIREHRK